MFEPFPGDYAWNLGMNLALIDRGNHEELDEVCQPLRNAVGMGAGIV